MLNPSTADENVLDPTVRRCLGFAMDWGFNRMEVANIFALRSTDPKNLYSSEDPVGPENDIYLKRMAHANDMVIVAWGSHGKHMKRGEEVARVLSIERSKSFTIIHCLKTTRDGQPGHPLYLNSHLKPVPYIPRKEVE
jgi:hypothetical protein